MPLGTSGKRNHVAVRSFDDDFGQLQGIESQVGQRFGYALSVEFGDDSLLHEAADLAVSSVMFLSW